MLFIALILIFSASAVQAGDVNVDDINSSGDSDLQIDDNVISASVNSEDDEIGNNESFLDDNVKNQSNLTSSTNSIYYGGSYKVTLTDSNTTEALANKTVYLSINNAAYSNTTDSKGVASFNLKLNPGSYLATAYFIGDDTYGAGCNLTENVKVLTTVKASDITKYYMGSKAYSATFLDSQGKALKNKKVTITVNGEKYTKKTNNNGVASLSIDFKPGTYKVTVNNPITGYSLTTTFKILSTVTSSSLKKVKGDSRKFIAKFFKSNGKALTNKQVKLKINGKVYYFKTDSKGEVIRSFNSFKKGTYKVISYNPDGLTKTSTVQIYNTASTKVSTSHYTFLPNDTKQIKIKFTTSLNDNSNSGKVIRIIIGGVSYSQKTDSKGEINFKLPSLEAGLYSLECEYSGNKFFKYSYVYRFLTILDTQDTQLTPKNYKPFGDYAGTPLNVAYTAGGVPLIRKDVTFNVNGQTYTSTTDDNGIASIPISLNVGNYTVSYRTSDDSKVKGTSGSCQIEVFKRANPNISCEFEKTYKDSSQTFKVKVTGSNGIPIDKGNVELTIDGETYTAVTNKNGYATFKTSVALGKYNVKVKFLGNNDYAVGSASKSTTVVLSKFASGINEKKGSASSSYLKSTRNCPVNNAKIKSLVKSLTKGLTNNIDKAKAIFNYVRDNVYYEYYYDTHKGAVGTLTSKGGNCADQSHLLVSMYRAAGFKARYVHGKCRFYDDGIYYGHVWTQVLIDNTWICGDAMNPYNQLGKINNWNVNTHKVLNKYLSIPF